MSVGEWLNSVIIDSATEDGVLQRRWSPDAMRPHPDGRPSARPDDPDDNEEWSHEATANEAAAGVRAKDEFTAVTDRLESLTKQFERLVESAAVEDDTASDDEHASARFVDTIARLDTRLDQLLMEGREATREIERRVNAVDQSLAALNRTPVAPEAPEQPAPVRAAEQQPADDNDWTFGLDAVIAEITARQHSLDGPVRSSAEALRDSSAPAPLIEAPPNRSAQILAGLQDQLRAITSQIATLRPCGLEDAVGTLRAELAEIGRTLNEAMPRRAIEALDAEVRALAHKIDDSRHNGTDASALSGIERGLAEVRDAVRALTPAEKLVGLDRAVQALSDRADFIAASDQDPAALQQLEASIDTLRGFVGHVASNDALMKLTEEVRALAAKVDRLESTTAGTGGGPAFSPQLETAVQNLTQKIERFHLSGSEFTALGHLEDRIVKLAEKLDASDARLDQLGALERGLAELLIHLQELRGKDGSAPRVAQKSPHVGTLQREVEEIRQTERRNQDSIETVHSTLAHLVDRLAMIETDLRADPRAQPIKAPTPTASERPVPVGPTGPQAPKAGRPNASPAPAVGTSAPAPRERRPIDPDLPPDHPLEPGSRGKSPSPAERIAASEAALGPTKPAASTEPTSKSHFIAAARRAAQAASELAPRTTAAAEAPAAVGESRDDSSLRTRLTQRVRSLIVGAGVILVVLVGARAVINLFDLSDQVTAQPPQSSRATTPVPTKSETSTAAEQQAPAPTASGSTAARSSGIVPGVDPSMLSAPASGLIIPGEPSVSAPESRPAVPNTSQEPAAPAAPDVTGSIPSAPASSSPAQPAAPLPLTPPAGAGISPALRTAATNGDPAAAFEIAARYAEGQGVTQDFAEAARWFERAAAKGLAPALFRLGSLYEKGLGVKRDLDTARRHYIAAADKGNAKAMHNLAVLYAEGIDGKPNFHRASEWFRKAANFGIADSQYNLAILYARGIGVDQNLAESYKWFALAAHQGDKDAGKKRDDVAARLDQQSLMAARLAAQTFTPEPQSEEGNTVKAPAGGWDRPTASPAKPKPRPQKTTAT